ncbi:ubiquinol-cytochrome-c reductase complex assembly factor 3 [Salminus brasiliensis]|uniref:ubiquinol-cytochrome-c reductase complex assembly factor 3 n=1 Tax=Salminus brasiliensis TaxID=930266 RepID=UPI003B834E8B
MSSMRTVLTSVAACGAVASGLGLWKAVAPGEERKREILKNLPESSPERMEESRRRNALIMQVLKEAAESDHNVAQSYGRQQ